MPNWKKVIVSGSNATLNSLNVTTNVVAQSFTGSLQGTSSWAVSALTASYANNFTVAGTLTAQTIVVQTITSSTDYVTGSTIFGSQLSNTHQFTGSVSITGSLTANGINNLTASNAVTASHAVNALTASYAVTASFASTASYVSSNFQYEVHVSQVDGNDTTGNGDLLKPVATIGKALLIVSASVASTDRRTIIVHPGTYIENITIDTTNTYFFSTGLLGANCLISGSVTVSAATRMSGLKMTNLIVSSSAPVYINNCAVDKQMTVSGSGYLEVQNTSLQCTSGIQVVGPASSGVIFENCSLYPLTVNNASAAVYIISCNQAITPTLTAGALTITRSTISSLTSGATSTALTTAAGSVLVLESCNVYNSLLTSHAAITANGFYSIKNIIYNRSASTLASLSGTGGPLATITQFQYINADNINSTQGLTVTGSITVSGSVINNLTSSFAVSASYALNATNAISASYATSASYANNATSASYALNADFLDGQDGSAFATTGSNIFIGNQTVTGSLFTSGSNTLIGSTTLTGSLSISGSTTQVGNNTLLGTTTLSGSVIISGSANASANFTLQGHLRLDPGQDPGNNNSTASYLFTSASNTATGYDLYYRQNGNLIKFKWVEGGLSTGLLYGGNISYSGSTIFVKKGSGIINNMNATTGSEINPILTYVNWNDYTASAQYLTSSQNTYLYVDNTGTIYQQTGWFNQTQYEQAIPLGRVTHPNYISITGVGSNVQTTYDSDTQQNDFIRAFGPIKVSGFSITPQTGSLSFGFGSGIAYNLGGFYNQDPNSPSHYEAAGFATASIARAWRSGSGVYLDNNGGAFYTTVDPDYWDDGTGVLNTMSAGDWQIQRVFANPVTGRVVVYYGQNTYTTLLNALQYLSTDSFVEGEFTAHSLLFIGYLVLKGQTNSLTDTANNRIIDAGIFRNIAGGSSGGGAVAQTLEDLSDVSITTPTNGQALIYNGGTWINGIPLNATSASFATTASYVLNAVSSSFASTSSFVQNAQSASYVLNAVSASYAATASYADNFTVAGTLTAQTIVVQTITSSTEFVTGSTRFGSSLSNTHQFTGSVSITGSLNVTGAGITGSLFGTSSWANNAITASNATTASYVLNAVSASFASTSSFVNPLRQTVQITGSLQVTGSTSRFINLAPNDTVAEFIAGGSTRTRFSYLTANSSTGIYFDHQNGSLVGQNYSYFTITGASSKIKLNTDNSANHVEIQPAEGNVAIGKTTTNAKLDISGSTIISGSFTVFTGSAVEFQVTNTGVRIGNIVTDTHTVTGSLNISGSSHTVTGSVNIVGSVSASGNIYQVGTGTGNASTVLASSGNTALLTLSSTGATINMGRVGAIGLLASSTDGGIIMNDGAYLGVSSGTLRIGSNLAANNVVIGNFANSTARINGNTTISGSTVISGSFTVFTGSAVELQVTNTGVNIGNVTTDVHTVTGSLNVSGSITTTGTITAQTLVVQTITSSTDFVTGSTIFGSLLSNTHQFTGSVSITGSLAASLTNVNQNNVVGYNTTTGQLFYQSTSSLSVTSASYALNATSASYAATASTANSGFTIGTTQTYTNTVASSVVGSNNVFTQTTGSYTSAFYKYTVSNGANARSGEVIAVWNGSSAQYTDYSTLDIGSTSGVTPSVSVVGSDILFNITTGTSGWRLKATVTYL